MEIKIAIIKSGETLPEIKEDKLKYNLTVLGVVAIVGIVAIVLGFMSSNNAYNLASSEIGIEDSDLVGEAASKLCTDSDGGKDYYKQGKTCIQRNCKLDACSNNKLTEHYCKTSKNRDSTTYKCPNGCANGACLQPDSCKDSDGGKNYEIQGTISGYFGGQYYEYPEYCYDSNNLVEFACDGSNPTKDLVSCNYGCVDGACVLEKPSITVISPNGGEKWEKGTMQTIRWANPSVGGGVILPSCVSCAAPPVGCSYIGGTCQSCGTLSCHSQPCVVCAAPPSGCFYVGGSCSSCGTVACSPSNPSTPPVPPLETVSINLFPYHPPCKTLNCPFYPLEALSPIASATTNDGSFEWKVGTTGGSMVPDGDYLIEVTNNASGVSDTSDAPFSIVTPVCYDSDGGINYNTKGYVSTNYNGQDINNKVFDSCISPDPNYPNQFIGVDSCSGSNCQVEDFYCDGYKGPYGSFYNCPSGCSNGACVSPLPLYYELPLPLSGGGGGSGPVGNSTS